MLLPHAAFIVDIRLPVTGRRAYLKRIVVLAINTGMRRGEILGLEWKNVDLSRGLIYFTNTKSGKDRAIRLNQTARSALESVKQHGQREVRSHN